MDPCLPILGLLGLSHLKPPRRVALGLEDLMVFFRVKKKNRNIVVVVARLRFWRIFINLML